jgi:two-component system sensor histidine kinase HydH
MGANIRSAQKWMLLAMLVAGITFLHYSTDQGQYYFHAFYGELYFLPIALAAFWFRLHGALIVSITISACYLPFIFRHWQNFSPNDLDKVLSLLLYNGLAVLAGVLKGRETAAQKKLLQVETLAVMGRSLAAAAHDMRTPLVVIGSCARRIVKKLGDKDPAHTKLALIIKETDKMESMTTNMLDFSKPLTLNLVRGKFDTTVQDSLAKLKEASSRKNVVLEYRCNPDVVDISIDTLRLEQVVGNLVVNAIQASPEGGTVAVNLYQSRAGDPILEVVDNGCGIPFEERQEVLNPFFTTKKEGTGLGLPIVKKIVDAHGWSLQILDNYSCGTTFRISMKESNLH